MTQCRQVHKAVIDQRFTRASVSTVLDTHPLTFTGRAARLRPIRGLATTGLSRLVDLSGQRVVAAVADTLRLAEVSVVR